MEIKSNEILDERVKAIFQELEIRKELKELKNKDDELETRLQDIKIKQT